MKGFTLIELLLVIGFMIIVLAITAPTALRFFGNQNLTDTTNTLMSSLRQAHDQAVFQKNDSSFGIKFLSGSYILFQGQSYAARVTSEDTTVIFPSAISISGISEILFTKRTGIPNTTGTILLQSGTKNASISISQQGTIELI